MFEITHEFWIRADREKVFDACATAEGLEAWWTLRTSGEPRLKEEYRFYFSDAHDWRGVARVCQPPRAIEWEMTSADEDWTDTRVGFELEPEGEGARVLFVTAAGGTPTGIFAFRPIAGRLTCGCSSAMSNLGRSSRTLIATRHEHHYVSHTRS
jgi:uncharacterized protein YndB with AHSA1/START domain